MLFFLLLYIFIENKHVIVHFKFVSFPRIFVYIVVFVMYCSFNSFNIFHLILSYHLSYLILSYHIASFSAPLVSQMGHLVTHWGTLFESVKSDPLMGH